MFSHSNSSGKLTSNSKSRKENYSNSENIPPKPKITVVLTKHGAEIRSPTPVSENVSEADHSTILTFEKALSEFIRQQIGPLKDKKSNINDLNNQISKFLKENSNLLNPTKKHKRKVSEPDNSKARIVELQNNCLMYEAKISSYSAYIQELETKVDMLIQEYEKLSSDNESLLSKIRLEEPMTSIHIKTEKLDSLIENEISLFDENNKMKRELQHMTEKVAKYEFEVSSFDSHNKELRDTNAHLKEKNNELAIENANLKCELAKKSSHNEYINEIQHQNATIQALRAQEEHFSKTIEDLRSQLSQKSLENTESSSVYQDLLEKQIQDYKTINEILQKKFDKASSQLLSLEEALAQANKSLELAGEKYENFEKEMLNKNETESQVKANNEIIAALEAKTNELLIQNEALANFSKQDADLIQELRSQISELKGELDELNLKRQEEEIKTTRDQAQAMIKEEVELYEKEIEVLKSEKATLEKSYTGEIESERFKYKQQLEKYHANLDVLTGKIQALVGTNEKVSRDFEILKTEFHNYRLIAWSVMEEIRKSLEFSSNYSYEIDQELTNLIHKGIDVTKLRDAYAKLIVHLTYISQIVEDKRRQV